MELEREMQQFCFEPPRVQDTFTSIEDDRRVLRENLEKVKVACAEIDIISKKHELYAFSSLSSEIKGLGHRDGLNVEELLSEYDKKFWETAFNISGIERMVTMTEKEKIRDMYRENPPEFTAVAARDMANGVQDKSAGVVLSTVQKVFDIITGASFLPGNEKDRSKKQYHNKRKIEVKFRYSWMRGYPEYFLEDRYLSFFYDLETACRIVNNEPLPENGSLLVDNMRSGFRTKQQYFETKWFSIYIYLNGNVKIEMKDQETIDRLNSWGSRGDKIA